MTRLHDSNRFVFWETNEKRGEFRAAVCGEPKVTAGAAWLTGVMGDVGSRVEQPVDAVAAVALHHRESVGLSVLLDDVSQLSITDAGLHC